MGLPFSMVGAMVVCSRAAPDGVAAVWEMISGPNSQLLATAILIGAGPSGARLLSMAAPGPENFIGNGCSAMAVTAFESVTTPPPPSGGADEWPPGARAVTFRVA